MPVHEVVMLQSNQIPVLTANILRELRTEKRASQRAANLD